MNHHFRTTQAADNLVLQYAAINHLMETKRGAHVRRLVRVEPGLGVGRQMV